MKKLIIMAFALIICGCAKKRDVLPTSDLATIKTQIVGNWTGTKNIATYTDLSGKSQVYDYGFVYNEQITATTADKTIKDHYGSNGLIVQEYAHAVSYSIITANGNNYINFEVSPGDVADAYQIVTLTDHLLVLHINMANFTGTGSALLGTNAVVDEEYSR